MWEVGRDEGVRQAGGRRGAAHQERAQRIDERVRPRQGVPLPFVLHPPVLEPNLGRETIREVRKRMKRGAGNGLVVFSGYCEDIIF